ncbi:MAG: substrate-binding domain-containing protein [Verrucomicrobiales bacterium]|nr:substrate-binding domain-containing protein [Verrucomicrobiales bacterium]
MKTILTLLAAAAFLTGCKKDSVGPAAGSTPARGAIGLSVLTATNPFFVTISDTMKDEAARHGYEVIMVSGENDSQKQASQVKDFITRKCAAIVLTPCDSRAIGSAIREANVAGIPVFTADIACFDAEAKVVSHIATDNYGGGKEAARGMIEALGPAGGSIAVLTYDSVESCVLRVKGFKEVLSEHNAGSAPGKITIAAELPCNGSREPGAKAAEDAINAHPNLAGIFAINDPAALGARAALEKAGKTGIKIIGFDGQPDGLAAIREGKIYADPVQFPDEIGRKTVEAIVKHFAGETVPPEILIPTKLIRQADAK